MYKPVFAYSSIEIIVLLNSIFRGFRVSIEEMLKEISNPISDTIINTHIISATKNQPMTNYPHNEHQSFSNYIALI